MSKIPRITDAERRARLVARHHLGRTADDVLDAVRGVVALHSSDPITPILACWARMAEFSVADLNRALYERRTLWRTHAMRRTLFVFPVAAAAVFDGAVAQRIARRERSRVERWLKAEMESDRVSDWLTNVEARVLDALENNDARRTQALTEAVPELATEITLGSGKWATRSRLSSRLLFLMAMEGRVVRARPAGSWRSSQYRWAAFPSWFGEELDRIDPADGRAELAHRYLSAYGPATTTDIRWWTGWTVRQTARALDDIEAVEVALDTGIRGFVLPDDLEPIDLDSPQTALLPGLDSTPMGWKQRAWYLGGHAERLFDRNGNAGPTVWVDGRIVGGWAQRDDGEVVFELLEDIGAEASERVAEEAAALTTWLSGTVANPRFRTPLQSELSA